MKKNTKILIIVCAKKIDSCGTYVSAHLSSEGRRFVIGSEEHMMRV